MANAVGDYLKEQVKQELFEWDAKRIALEGLCFGLEAAAVAVGVPAIACTGIGVVAKALGRRVADHNKKDNEPHPSNELTKEERDMAEKYPHVKKVVDEQVDKDARKELGLGKNNSLLAGA